MLSIDQNLTPENCEQKGYEWQHDSIYDPKAPAGVNDNFVEMINSGWKLGKPASQTSQANGMVGVYKPIELKQ